MYTATKVKENFTSHTFTEDGLYVFTGSADGGYNVTIGGTSEVLYTNHISAGTVGIIWAKNGDTMTVGSANYNMLVKIGGLTSKPKVKLLNSGANVTETGKAKGIYIGCGTAYSHNYPSSLNVSFSCSDATVTTINHSNAGWSKNAMSLILPNSEQSMNASAGATDGAWMAYLFQVQPDNCKVKINGNWKDGKMFVKANGSWKEGSIKIKVNGNWKGAI